MNVYYYSSSGTTLNDPAALWDGGQDDSPSLIGRSLLPEDSVVVDYYQSEAISIDADLTIAHFECTFNNVAINLGSGVTLTVDGEIFTTSASWTLGTGSTLNSGNDWRWSSASLIGDVTVTVAGLVQGGYIEGNSSSSIEASGDIYVDAVNGAVAIDGGGIVEVVTNIYDGQMIAATSLSLSAVDGGTYTAPYINVYGTMSNGIRFNGSVAIDLGLNPYVPSLEIHGRLQVDNSGIRFLYSPDAADWLDPADFPFVTADDAPFITVGTTLQNIDGRYLSPAVEDVREGTKFGALDEDDEGTEIGTLVAGGDEEAAAAAQLATDVAAVTAARADIVTTRTLLGVQGHYLAVDPVYVQANVLYGPGVVGDGSLTGTVLGELDVSGDNPAPGDAVPQRPVCGTGTHGSITPLVPGTAITLTTATASAYVFYSIDGRLPLPYTDPIVLPLPCSLVAYSASGAGVSECLRIRFVAQPQSRDVVPVGRGRDPYA